MNFVRQGFRKLSSNRHTDRQTNKQTVRQTDRHDHNYILRRFAGGQLIWKHSQFASSSPCCCWPCVLSLEMTVSDRNSPDLLMRSATLSCLADATSTPLTCSETSVVDTEAKIIYRQVTIEDGTRSTETAGTRKSLRNPNKLSKSYIPGVHLNAECATE